MELKDLVGKHELSGCDFGSAKIASEYDGNCVRFVLDGTTYLVREDENDGYRSSMRDIAISETPSTNTFPPITVVCVHRERESKNSGECDLLDVIDVVNGKCVLSVGTANTDDYYPSFVADWNPANMHTNESPE